MLKSSKKIIIFIFLSTQLHAGLSFPTLDFSSLTNKLDVNSFIGDMSSKIGNAVGNFEGVEVPQLDFLKDMNLGGVDGGALGKFVQNGVTDAITNFGNNFLNGRCSVGLPTLGGSGGIKNLCESLTSGLGGALAPIEDLIKNGIAVGQCRFGANISSKCALKWLKEECQQVEATVKEVAQDMKDYINEKWEDVYEDTGMHDKVRKVRKKVNELYNNTRHHLSEMGKKFKTFIGLDESLKNFMSGKSCEDVASIDSLLDKQMGGSNNATLRDTLDTEALLFVELSVNSSYKDPKTAKLVFDCVKSALPKDDGIYTITKKINGKVEIDNNKLNHLISTCDPQYMTLQSPAETFSNIVKTAQNLSKETNVNYADNVQLSNDLTQELNNKCVKESNYTDAKKCELKIKSATNTDKNSVAYRMNIQESNNIREIEEQTAQFLAILNEVYPNELGDTSNLTLENYLPSHRAYFIYQARKQNFQDSLILSFAKKIEQSKKELARITMAKIKECSTPFYYASAVKEVAETISDARKEAEEVVDKIINSN